MLKKQTIWLLTMLSLVIVLSAYYITTPEMNSNQFSLIKKDAGKVVNKNVKTISGSNDNFTALRMQLEDKRSAAKEDLQTIVASASASAMDKSKALDEMDKLAQVSEKESVLETLLKSEKSITDALVVSGEKEVKITLTAKESSATLANKVMKMARNELGDQPVAVEIQTQKN